jgi:hypothetical protein
MLGWSSRECRMSMSWREGGRGRGLCRFGIAHTHIHSFWPTWMRCLDIRTLTYPLEIPYLLADLSFLTTCGDSLILTRCMLAARLLSKTQLLIP